MDNFRALLDDELAGIVDEYWDDIYNRHPVESERIKNRTQARRAVLMALHGGVCAKEGCHEVVKDFDNPVIWEFDHIYDRHKYKTSPTTGMKQFPISGSDCGRRSWPKVLEHCLFDTRLVCYKCHEEKNEEYWDPSYTKLTKDFAGKLYKSATGKTLAISYT